MGTGGQNVPILYQKIVGTILARDYKGIDTFDVEESKVIIEKNSQPEVYQKTVGALQARDYKGVGNQYVNEGKLVVEKQELCLNDQGGKSLSVH